KVYRDMAASTVRALSALLLGAAILVLGQGLLLTLVPQAMSVREFSVQAVSFVGAAYFAGFFTGAWRGDAILRSVGHIRAYGGLIALIIVAVLSLPFFSNAVVWFILRFLHGFAAGGAFLAIEAWLNSATDERSRGKVLATYMVVTLGGLGFAQFLSAAGDVGSQTPFIVGGILFAASIIPVVLTRIEVPVVDSAEGIPVREVYRYSPFGFVATFAAGMGMGAFWALGPFFAAELDGVNASTLMATAVFAGLLLQWPVGYFSDRCDRRAVAAFIAGVAAIVALLVFAFMGTLGPWVVYVFFAFLGGQFCLYPLAMAHAVDQARAQGAAMGVARGLIMAVGLGQTVGPLAAGAFLALSEPNGFLLFFAVVLGGVALYTRRRMKLGVHVVPEQQSAYVFTRTTTPVGAELDPRTDETFASIAPASDHESQNGGDAEEGEEPGEIRDRGQNDG
ncbi:MAG: MFS transporter, partial [Rhodospirillaceae bacterium]